ALFAEDDDRRRQLEFGPDPLGDSSKSALEFRIGHQAHNVIEHDGLALSCLCLACSLVEQGGWLAGDDPGDEEGEQRYDLVVAGHTQRVMRLYKKEVEGE